MSLLCDKHITPDGVSRIGLPRSINMQFLAELEFLGSSESAGNEYRIV